jgi:hypothetical protein
VPSGAKHPGTQDAPGCEPMWSAQVQLSQPDHLQWAFAPRPRFLPMVGEAGTHDAQTT